MAEKIFIVTKRLGGYLSSSLFINHVIRRYADSSEINKTSHFIGKTGLFHILKFFIIWQILLKAAILNATVTEANLTYRSITICWKPHDLNV